MSAFTARRRSVLAALCLLMTSCGGGSGGEIAASVYSVGGLAALAYVPALASGDIMQVLALPTDVAGEYSDPVASLTTGDPADYFVSIASDGSGNVYVGAITQSNGPDSNPRLLEFAAGSGSTAPVRTIQLSMQPGGALRAANAIALDGAGNLYAEVGGVVLEFGPRASGNAVPTRSITVNCDQLAVDRGGILFCSHAESGTVSVYGPTQSGNDLPITIALPPLPSPFGPDNAAQAQVESMALDSAGALYVAYGFERDDSSPTVCKYVAGVDGVYTGTTIDSLTVGLNNFVVSAMQFDAHGNLYVLQDQGQPTNLLIRFAALDGDFAQPTTKGLNATIPTLGGFAIH